MLLCILQSRLVEGKVLLVWRLRFWNMLAKFGAYFLNLIFASKPLALAILSEYHDFYKQKAYFWVIKGFAWTSLVFSQTLAPKIVISDIGSIKPLHEYMNFILNETEFGNLNILSVATVKTTSISMQNN